MVDELRPITEDEYGAWQRVLAAGFSEVPEPDQTAMWRAFTEFDRTLGAVEDGEFVGTTAAFSFEMSVPGGAMVPTGGVTAVAVLPTHTRRGVLTAMMRRQLDDIRERGEPLAALGASESLIYGRFGYGLAIAGEHWQIDRVRAQFLRPPGAETGGRVRIIQRSEALERFPAAYERTLGVVPGGTRHPETWWPARYAEANEMMQKIEPFLVVFERNGVDEGYATYAVRELPGTPAPRELQVRRFYPATSEAHEALWRYIFSVDLIDTIEAHHMATDDPLPWMLTDPRRLRRNTYDVLWLRLVDVPAALEARTYARPGRLTIEVNDAFCPWNQGTYTLEVDDDGAASCTASGGTPDLSLDVDALGAIYLGGTSLATLALAGRATEHADGALARASAMFRTERAPWNPLIF